MPAKATRWNSTNFGECPYCTAQMTPKPKRSRTCLYCGGVFYLRNRVIVTKEDARRYDVEHDLDPKKWMTDDERKAAIEEDHVRQRAAVAKQLEILNHPLVSDEFPYFWISATHDGRCCDICESQDEKLILRSECTVADLPPFEGCENDVDGCRCLAIPFSPEDAEECIKSGQAWVGRSGEKRREQP